MRRGDRRRWRPRTGRLPLWVLQVRSHGDSASPLLFWAATPPRRVLPSPLCYAVSSFLLFSVSSVRVCTVSRASPDASLLREVGRTASLKRQSRHAARAAIDAREWLASSTDCPPSCDPVFPLCVRAQCRSQCENARETKIERRLVPGLQAQASCSLALGPTVWTANGKGLGDVGRLEHLTAEHAKGDKAHACNITGALLQWIQNRYGQGGRSKLYNAAARLLLWYLLTDEVNKRISY